MTGQGAAFAVLPELTEANRHFWQGGRAGRLVLLRCADCGYCLHPPIPVCPRDGSKDVRPRGGQRAGDVASYTVNHHPGCPGSTRPTSWPWWSWSSRPGCA